MIPRRLRDQQREVVIERPADWCPDTRPTCRWCHGTGRSTLPPPPPVDFDYGELEPIPSGDPRGERRDFIVGRDEDR